MSISGSLSNAYSGLTAASRAAETVSANVANALTEGYGRREVQLSSASISGQGAGVRVNGIQRVVDDTAIANRRGADADLGNASSKAAALASIENAIGLPGDGDSLSDRVTSLESALLSATSRPDSQTRLQNVLTSAQNLARQFNKISAATQTVRLDADRKIAHQVEILNTTLAGIAELNSEIRAHSGGGVNAVALMDQRQILVDQISSIVPLKILPREHGQIALMSAKGAVLLDGQASTFEFTGVGVVTADMTLADGGLSGLLLNGREVDVVSGRGMIEGGSLSALFDVRDRIAPQASAQIDAVARDLVERFEDPFVDPTLASGVAGLFTDDGAAFDASEEVGLAGRLKVNAAADPQSGGQLWRLRDGLGATTAGSVGDSMLLDAMSNALGGMRNPGSGSFASAQYSVAGLVAELGSVASAARLNAEQEQSFSVSRVGAFKEIELASGVDTDHELRRLLLVEQSYAANARVISALDSMLQTLLEM